MSTLTKRQKQVLNFIQNYSKKNEYSPSLEEIADHLGLSSVATVHEHVSKLKEKGILHWQENQQRSIEISATEPMFFVPLLGKVAAGKPIEAVQERENFAFPKNKLPKTTNIYALRVQGNSMIEEGINDGDVILVQEQKTALNGQKVVAIVDGGATVKKFYKEKSNIRLVPANRKMSAIIITKNNEFSIQGIVLDVVKSSGTPTKSGSAASQLIQVRPCFETKDVEIYNADILNLGSITANSVDLIVTSPPYNVDIHYNSHDDNLSYGEYLDFTREWMKKCFELSKEQGRFLLNVPLDKNKGGQQSVGADFTRIAKEIGWQYHSTIIWNEGNISRRTAWGSWMSASAPYVIAPVELVLVLYKGSWKKTSGSKKNDISRKEFMDWTNGVWTFNGQNKKGAGGHPAAFPIELPKRCIKLFSFVGDTVLDPFLGSGSTLIASSLYKRRGIGVEIDKKYCDIAVGRLQKEANINQKNLL